MLQRVQKIISNAGFCSRRKAEQLIEKGRVKVNGKTISIGDKANPDDKITIDNRTLMKPKKVYLMLNKPKKYLTSLSDPSNKQTIMNLIRIKERVIPVGRLDFMTEGLLILTNDGDFANKIMHPRYEIEKTYVVTLKDPITNDQLEQIKKGIKLEDGIAKAKATIGKDKKIVTIKIHMGKNRVIRRMMKALGHQIFRLQRVAIGKLKLGDLESGKHRFLSKKEINYFS